MKRYKTTLCGAAQREVVAKFGYWQDKRWKQVHKLRQQEKIAEANQLVMQILDSYGVD